MANNNRNRNRGGGGGRGQGPQTSIPQFYISGALNAATLSAKVMAGQNPKEGALVEFLFGEQQEPDKFILLDPTTNAPRSATANILGWAKLKNIDLTGFKDCTHGLAVTRDPNTGHARMSELAPLPSEVASAGKAPATKRFRVTPTDETLTSYTNNYSLTIQTFDSKGKHEGKQKLRLIFSGDATVINATTKRILGTNISYVDVTTDNVGFINLQIRTSGLSGSVTIIHIGSGETLTKKFQFE